MGYPYYLMFKLKVYKINGISHKKGTSYLRKDPYMPTSRAALHFEIDASGYGKAHLPICILKL